MCLEMHWKWISVKYDFKKIIGYYCCFIIKMFLCARSIMKLLCIFSLCLLHRERFLLKQWRINFIAVHKGNFHQKSSNEERKKTDVQNSTADSDNTLSQAIHFTEVYSFTAEDPSGNVFPLVLKDCKVWDIAFTVIWFYFSFI